MGGTLSGAVSCATQASYYCISQNDIVKPLAGFEAATADSPASTGAIRLGIEYPSTLGTLNRVEIRRSSLGAEPTNQCSEGTLVRGARNLHKSEFSRFATDLRLLSIPRLSIWTRIS